MDSIYGLRVVTAKNVYDVLAELGVTRWNIREEIPIAEYMARNLTERQRKELRFVPPVAAAICEAPDGSARTYFHIAPGRVYSITFAVLPSPMGSLVPVTATYRPAPKCIILQLPSGGFKKGEDIKVGAIREFEEETRIKLADIELLRRAAVPVHVGSTGDLIFMCLGFPTKPVEYSDRKLDEGEFVGTVLFQLDEWLALLDDFAPDGIQIGDTTSDGPDMVTIGTTFLALRRLRRIRG